MQYFVQVLRPIQRTYTVVYLNEAQLLLVIHSDMFLEDYWSEGLDNITVCSMNLEVEVARNDLVLVPKPWAFYMQDCQAVEQVLENMKANDIYDGDAEHMLEFLLFLLMGARLQVMEQCHGLLQKHYWFYVEQGL
jgi:hypothetical protein